jgi:hypothetical protein
MNDALEFLKSVRTDLTDRRLVPLVGLALAGLVAALAFALLAGGSSSPSPSASAGPPAPVTHVAGAGLTPAPQGVSNAVAETTNGSSLQQRGGARNPFAPLVQIATTKLGGETSRASVATSGSSSTSSKAGGSTTGGGSGSSGGSTKGSSHEATPSTPSKPKAPAKPKTVYEVTLALGPIPAGSTLPSTELKSLPPVSKPTPLPSATQKLVEFMGVTVTRKATTATFAVVGEVIMRGSGTCLPSPTQCKLLNLKAGTGEQLEYLQANGEAAALELRVGTITPKHASTAAFGRLLLAEHKAAAKRGDGWLLAIAGLHYSRRGGVLVYSWHQRR